MKNKFIILLMLIISAGFSSCEEGLEEVNINPNDPEVVPTANIFTSATKQFTDFSRDAFNSGRLTQVWVQYWGQTAYADEDRYLYRETSAQSIYQNTYLVATDLKSIIDLNSNEETRDAAASSGNNNNQIAASRIMLSYMFYELTNFFGDVPYYSYGNDDPDFQALSVDTNLSPVFAPQEKIYADILNELRESADMINTNEQVFTSGDNIFNGDATKWKKFANSLILRVANNLRNVDAATANAAITTAIQSGVMTSNADNAVQSYETTDLNASPMWVAFIGRTDFAVAAPFINLLKGETGNFGLDPRLFEMAAPISASIQEVKDGTYTRSEDPDDYFGAPYAFRNMTSLPFTAYSFMSSNVLKPDFGEVLMEYSEVAFILSEQNGFDQVNYENGVRASMQKWGVEEADINAYIATLPAASQANVLNQKYIALYMQPNTAYATYRKTGFPNTLLLPGDTVRLPENQIQAQAPANRIETYTFESGVNGVTDLPFRLRYPQILQTLNRENRSAAAAGLENGDTVLSKLFWDVN
ncbi:SusD/RagB family nutrient-binding outer membrane lipoprotein [Leeuwenhoekiella aequorea]|uniref:SusD-like starch-binding protein associating with outer membrane n=1 Tax=Leeuwenhoekiella aequorea TaxID=283736 RepID=A0A4Q0P7L6_9FLAO|nr:SusD/RagB family nutrient-binding outer membrane lipoprotein [Leeuwenhoekiella aequorea]RXG22694.1 SusD-like starch-binding protein associating with outer membrane [Leeuwenhoekiella aequorea]|tara:strand:+ start:4407 stop:5996 length:1590 start_codon:yes stop_codon:yes gene_type:complete